MPKILPTLHGYLDFATVLVFLIAPGLFGMTGAAAAISYALAIVHLSLTLLTDFPAGIVKLVPYPVHGAVERIVGPVLVVLPFVLGFEGMAVAFYFLMGVAIIAVSTMSDYGDRNRRVYG